MKVVLLTHPPGINKASIFELIKKIQNRNRGPRAVLESLKRGLKNEGIPFRINPNECSIKEADIVHVIEGVATLSYAIKLKKAGSIKKLIAGPAIVVTPFEHNSILLDNVIDRILFPSQWPKEYYVSKCPFMKNKIEVWPAGIEDPYKKSLPPSSQKKSGFIIYDKLFDVKLRSDIEKILISKKISFLTVSYGSFKQKDFFKKLESSSGMIYLSASESQGLALQEAWIRDVPTYVLRQTEWKYRGEVWNDEKIAAPYLTKETGIFFDNTEDLGKLIDNHVSGKVDFSPRSHTLKNFTDTASVLIYKQILNNVLSKN